MQIECIWWHTWSPIRLQTDILPQFQEKTPILKILSCVLSMNSGKRHWRCHLRQQKAASRAIMLQTNAYDGKNLKEQNGIGKHRMQSTKTSYAMSKSIVGKQQRHCMPQQLSLETCTTRHHTAICQAWRWQVGKKECRHQE